MQIQFLALLVLGLALMSTGCEEPPKPTVNLYRAVHIGDIAQIKRHLYWGTDVNQPGPDGDYPLHVAVSQGRIAIAKELLRHGADVNAKDALGRTPLHRALASGKVPSASLLLDQEPEDDLQGLLFELVRAGTADPDTLAFLVRQGVDINAYGEDGSLPIHSAVASGDVKLAKRLITAGADVNLPNARGSTPLAIAQTIADPASAKIITQLLAQYGAIR